MKNKAMQHNTVKTSRNQGLCAVALLVAMATVTLLPGAAAAVPLPIDREPLVIYDISGYGYGGPVHQHLTIYSDGLATYSSLSLSGVWADFTWVTSGNAVDMNAALIAAGGLELSDRPSNVADLPMTTVTVFDGSQPDAVHNTFSFYDIGEGRQYSAVVDMLKGFIKKSFLD